MLPTLTSRTLPLTNILIAEDDAKRYIADKEILIKTPDRAHIAAMIVRPKSAKAPLPALLIFTIYADDEQGFYEARKMAARGYAGVAAYTRGNWISEQPWSDGRVGMYGGSYDGFTQWAATMNLHPALKTIVPYVANNPGDGLPMENNVFLFVNYAWAFYTTNNKTLDWDGLNDKWYASGKPYRQIDAVDGTPNKWFQRWLRQALGILGTFVANYRHEELG